MQVTELRLSGFKSFVEPAELYVEAGLTGIVGPNGCGKSNLLEALCWVMGEASFRKMRAKSMEEVIFSGTSVRPAYNFAEATVVIDNNERRARTPYRDVETIEITRRIERDGGSTYSINGNPVLARDARVLFADMIGGAHSPFLVHQGRIAQLISSTPTERRVLLDQAAGIGGLRARRHEAELQINAASTNLDRLNQAIGELQCQLDSLKRQERQARRYRVLGQRIRATEALLLHARWQEAQKEETTQRELIAQADERLKITSREAARRSIDLHQANEALDDLRKREAKSTAGLNRIKMELEHLDTRERQLQERKKNLNTRLIQTEKDLEHEAARLQDFEATQKRLAEEESRHDAARPETKRLMQQAVESIAAARQKVAGLESAVEGLLAEIARQRSKREEAEREVARCEERSTLLSSRLEDLRQEHRRLMESRQREYKPASEQPIQEQHLMTLRTHENEAERASQTARQNEIHAREAFEEGEREEKRIAAEIATLQELLGETKNGDKSEFPGIIHEITVEPNFEIALGSSLGSDLDASLDAEAPIRWRRMELLGPPADLPAGVRPLQEHIRAPEALNQRLSQIGVVSREHGAALQVKLSPGQSLVSIEGDFWRWDGYSATAEALAGATAEKLRRRNRLHVLVRSRIRIKTDIPALQQRFLEARKMTQTAATAEETARLKRRQSEKNFFEERELALRIRQENQERTARLEAMEKTTVNLQEEQAEVERLATRAGNELETLANAADLETKANEMREKLREAREQLAKELAQAQAVERDMAGYDRRLNEIAAELASWEKRVDAIGEQMESLWRRRQQCQEELAALKGEPEMNSQLRDALLQQLGKAEAETRETRDELAVGESRCNECAKQEEAARENAGAAREERARRSGLLEGASQRLQDTTAQIRRELDCSPEQIPELTTGLGGRLAGAGTDESPDTLEERLWRLQSERDRIGGVNLRAEEEARETRERLEAITGEQEDLLGAISRLRQAMNSLNREGRDRLGRAFTLVDKNFTELFTRLFGGGTAYLRLVEGETEEGEETKESKNLLEAGLEIMARPPGKRLQSLSLLSGGEQTLTALALIFAVFLANAPPICVLDEADAPLDDINVERFCRLVRDVCETSGARILLITHHPLTMARMDRLFGVTMQERGVSRLVSVDLEQDGGIRQSALAAGE